MRFYFKAGMWINFVGSLAVTSLIVLFSRSICGLFGLDAATLNYTLRVMPFYVWGFVVMAFNVMISAYLYSTEKPVYSMVINVLRSFVMNIAVIMLLPLILGADIVWFTFGIYEAVVLVVAWLLLKRSESNGVFVYTRV